MPSIYDRVPGNHPAKNRFDLSHSHFMSMRVGLLYVALCKEMYPGDVFKVSDAVHCQLQPMVAPLLSDLNLYAHTFFVPYRLIYGVDNLDGKPIWEKYITGGDDGDYDTPLPAWEPDWTKHTFSSETIWDSIGNPVALDIDDTDPDHLVYSWTPVVPSGLMVSKAPKLAYNFIVNNYYIDENLMDPYDLDNEDLVYACWKKDYFTSALESQQFGTAPAMPVDVRFSYPGTNNFTNNGYLGGTAVNISGAPGLSGYARIVGDSLGTVTSGDVGFNNLGSVGVYDPDIAAQQHYSDPILTNLASGSAAADVGSLAGTVADKYITYSSSNNPITFLNKSVSGFGFDVAKMRLMFAVQRLMELSMTGGHRYTEFLQSHFGCSPSDARLDRPEYIGGCVFPVNVSVSVQNSETSLTPQGNKVGIGNINDVEYVGSYRAEEYGLIMTLISIRPKPCYQQGISKEWLRQNRFMFYSPEMANLSEDAIYNAEIFVDPTDTDRPDNGIFGYQAHWNELRASNNIVSGSMREQFDYWLMSRKFASRPALNADFVSLGHPTEYNRIWAVQDEDQFIVAWSNIIDAYRPLPAYGTPGLIDHVYGGK